jgi:arylsulfatase A-like enzyme
VAADRLGKLRTPTRLGVVCVLHGAALGLVVGLWGAWRDVSAQGYAALGFTRSIYLAFGEHALAGARTGAWAGACAGAVLFVSALLLAASATRIRSAPAALARALGSRAALAASALLLLLWGGLVLGLGRSLGAPSLHAQRPWNVVLIGIDTLRADATSIRGPSLRRRDTTPNLRKLAERGVAFDRAVSQAPWTMPAFGSMLTGKYPHEHGAYSLSGSMRPQEVMLAEVLREAGYATHGVVSNMYVSRQRAFDQGFDTFDDSNTFDNRAITSRAITDLSIRALEQSGDRPFFLFAHYFDPHFEYMDNPDLPWADAYRGWLREELDFFDNLLRMRHLVDDEDVGWLMDLYEEEISHVDREIGRLVEWLDARGLSERTLIVVSADHGEEFVDHESFGHTQSLFEEQLHVPLVVVAPGGVEPSRTAEVVETRAIFGTVLDALGLDFDAGARARSLLASGSDAAHAFSVLWLADAPQLGVRRFRLTSLREGRWKLIRDYTRDRVHLYDLEADPRERTDLAADRPEIRDRLRELLEAWTQEQRSRAGEPTTVTVDPETQRKLEELGYL